MNILLTGGAGFIGSQMIRYILTRYPESTIVNVDSLTYASSTERIKQVENNENYHFVKANILETNRMKELLHEYKIEVVLHFAAESHVDCSIVNSLPFVRTNVDGTASLLEAAREVGIERFLYISTDEVYGSVSKGKSTEKSPICPRNPYSSSKAGAEHMVMSYFHTYQLPVLITRSSNNYGSYHHPEKLIPLLVTNALSGKTLPLYGDGQHIRTWLHVSDHCRAIDTVLRRGNIGQTYNIGSEEERSNEEVALSILHTLDLSPNNIRYVKDRLGHDRRYALDSTKIQEYLGWFPKKNFEQGLIETIDWYQKNASWWKSIIERA